MLRSLVRNLPAQSHTSPSICRCRSFTNFLAQQIAAAAERPFLRTRDVVLLGLIQFAAIGDMRGDQTAYFLRRQRGCGTVRLLENVAHRLVPKQPWACLADKFVKPTAVFGLDRKSTRLNY